MSVIHKIKTLFNIKNTIALALAFLFVLSLITIYFAFVTNQNKNTLTQNLADKEEKIASLNTQVKNLLKENTAIRSEDARKELTTIHDTIDEYESVKSKVAEYKGKGVDVSSVEPQLPNAIDLILQKKYTEAKTLLDGLNTSLETSLQAVQAAAAKAKSSTSVTSCNVIPTSGYCRMYVNASSGSFLTDIVAANISSISVITDTATSSDCKNIDCAAKSLQEYIQTNGGFAGMNGTYFCPPDYSSCSGKAYSFDFAVYNTGLSKWIRQDAVARSDTAMMAFTNSSAYFYPNSNSFTSLPGFKAAITNFPGLVSNGTIIVGNYVLTSAQYTKSTRGGIAVKGSTVYLVVTRSASVPDLANVMQAIGVTNALNLDGGGSSALYYNGYKVGPGRLLPNAVILK